MNDCPIGIFDSGFGGLTVLDALVKTLPNESFIYLGDTANLPYGNKAPQTVLNLAKANAEFLFKKKIKLLVVACHTACAYAIEHLQSELKIPVIGVSESGCHLIVKATQIKQIAILGTLGTISSQSIEKTILSLDPSITIFPQACPLFVPIVEEGFHNHAAAKLIAEHYLLPLTEKKIDAALLACTHYPILKDVIQKILGPAIRLIEPANATAQAVLRLLQEKNLQRQSKTPAFQEFYASENPAKFKQMAPLFFSSRSIDSVSLSAK